MNKLSKIIFSVTFVTCIVWFLIATFGCQQGGLPFEDNGNINNATNSNGTTPDYNPGNQWRLFWSDEFNGSAIDTDTWGYDTGQHGWGNGEYQNYTTSSENSYVENGNLVIKAIYNGGGYNQRGNYTSARLISEGKFSFKYGLVLARMKAPEGKGIWPAIWMLGEQDDNDIGWGYDWPQCGEIDIFEMFGGQGDLETSLRRTTGALHWDNSGWTYRSGALTNSSRLSADFNYYSVEWNEQKIIWRFNGQEFFSKSITSADRREFHSNFFLLINIAVGSTGGQLPLPDSSTSFPQTMEIDWIRIYTNINGTSGSSNSPVSASNAATSGAARVFSDSSSLTSLPIVPLQTNLLGNQLPGFQGLVDNSQFSYSFTNGTGALSSSNFLRLNLTGNRTWGIIEWRFANAFNMQQVNNTSISFYIRSSTATNISLKIGGPVGSESITVKKSFTADGEWHKVNWAASELTGSANRNAVVSIIPVLNDSVSSINGNFIIDIDEVQFTTNN